MHQTSHNTYQWKLIRLKTCQEMSKTYHAYQVTQVSNMSNFGVRNKNSLGVFPTRSQCSLSLQRSDSHQTTPTFKTPKSHGISVATFLYKKVSYFNRQVADLGTRLQAAFSSALKAALHSGFRRDFQSGRAFLEAEFVASDHTVDVRNPANHLGSIKPCKQWDKHG